VGGRRAVGSHLVIVGGLLRKKGIGGTVQGGAAVLSERGTYYHTSLAKNDLSRKAGPSKTPTVSTRPWPEIGLSCRRGSTKARQRSSGVGPDAVRKGWDRFLQSSNTNDIAGKGCSKSSTRDHPSSERILTEGEAEEERGAYSPSTGVWGLRKRQRGDELKGHGRSRLPRRRLRGEGEGNQGGSYGKEEGDYFPAFWKPWRRPGQFFRGGKAH